jgi:hypothetical protein
MALKTLAATKSATLRELAHAIADAEQPDASALDLIYDDLRGIIVVGWIEPSHEDSRRFCLTKRGRSVLAASAEGPV